MCSEWMFTYAYTNTTWVSEASQILQWDWFQLLPLATDYCICVCVCVFGEQRCVLGSRICPSNTCGQLSEAPPTLFTPTEGRGEYISKGKIHSALWVRNLSIEFRRPPCLRDRRGGFRSITTRLLIREDGLHAMCVMWSISAKPGRLSTIIQRSWPLIIHVKCIKT